MKNVVKSLVLSTLLMLMAGCKTPAPIVTTVEKERIVEVHTRDTAIIIEADSASIRALFRCDSAFNVILDELVTMQGDRIEAELQLEKASHGGVIVHMDCHEDSLINEIQLRDSVINELTKNTEIVRERYVPGYYKFCSWGFWILLIILLVIVGFKVYKLYLKFQTSGLTSILK